MKQKTLRSPTTSLRVRRPGPSSLQPSIMSLGMHGRSGARPLQPTNTLLHPLWRLRGQPHYRALRCHRRRSRRQRPDNDRRHSRCTRRPRCHSRRCNSCCRRHGCCRCCTLVRGPISCCCGCCGRRFTTSHSRPAHAAATRAAADDDATWVRAPGVSSPHPTGDLPLLGDRRHHSGAPHLHRLLDPPAPPRLLP